jgi:hypothetical protein
MKTLVEFLNDRGWNHEDAFEVWNEYVKGGSFCAKDIVSWMDDGNDPSGDFEDKATDYVGEMEDDIIDWENLIIEKQLPHMRTIRK